MKIKDGFILRNVADTHIVVPVGANMLNVKGMLSLNESGAFLWEVLMKGADENSLLTSLLDEYEVDEGTAKEDISGFLNKIREIGALDE